MKECKLFLVALVSFVTPAFGAVYTWTDDKGNVHYSDRPPSAGKAREIKLPSQVSPAPAEIGKTRQGIENGKKFQKLPDQEHGRESKPDSRSLPLPTLGALPPNESSVYVETFATSIGFDTQKLVGQFIITLKAKRRLPFGAYLEAHFENPANPHNPIVIGKVRQGGEEKMVILSPQLKGFKCRDYEVVVYVYRGSSKSKLLGTHHQRIQSKVNLDRIKTAKGLLEAMIRGNCP